ncbi:MAG: tannase/feruloyl esterase family alpha/beta hydrolase [Acidobacteriia bacterium]|nr:tannase/feruloyl esterase family alpha/beta hydrolase [Terriglobia bacterium]
MRVAHVVSLLALSAAWVAAAPQTGNSSPGSRCTNLLNTDAKQLPSPATRFESAVANAARAAQGEGPAVPAHCEVIGLIHERVGFNSQRFAIRFHMRLPDDWNGRFFFEGGGGSNGNLGAALGNLQGSQRRNALQLGYAVVSQDSGHDNTINNDPNLNGTSVFAFDPQARTDWGYNSYDQVTQTAKALIRIYYGRAPERSYYVGCSEGGREGVLMSQKFPAYFDGILACAPGIRIPRAALTQAWNFQIWAAVAKAAGIYDRDGVPFVNKALTDEDLALAASAVLEACDTLDGAKDGMVLNFEGCSQALVHPKLAAVTCQGGKRASCLSQAQVSALERIISGPRDANGEPLYSDWAWDAGFGGAASRGYFQGWRSWSIGDYEAASVSSIATALVATSSAASSTPPEPVKAFGPDAARYLLNVDINTVMAKATATNRGTFPVSTWDLMNMGGTDLSAFRNRGGKLLIAHGVSDPIFSVKDSIAWFKSVNQANNGNASAFLRVFPVPGMNHCAGGPATDQFDAFAALVDWVEKSTAPERIVATAGNATPWPGRTRPLCLYPKHAQYKGSGNIEDAASFECR